MIINADEKLVAELLVFLKKLGVTVQDCTLAEGYLNGETGDGVLQQFQKINFTSLPAAYEMHDEMAKLMTGLDETEGRQVCERFFNVLYAIGHTTCHILFLHSILNKLMYAEACELHKVVAVYIEGAAEETGYLRRHQIDYLIGVVRSDTERFRKSMDCLRGEDSKYYLSAMAVYFCKKYGVIKPLTAEDAALMKEYEEKLLGCLDEWLGRQRCAGRKRIVSAISGHQLAKELLEGVGMCSLAEPAWRELCFICSMAYLNFLLSDVLRDIARTCLAVDVERSLFTFADVSVGTLDASRRIGTRGGDYDDLFWIDSETYIRWAAIMEYTHILKRQLVKNQEIYLRAMEEDGFQVLITKKRQTAPSDVIRAVNVLKDLLKKENPGLYEQFGAGKPDYERVIGYLVEDTPHAETAREYLRGNCSISGLYPYMEEFRRGIIPDGYMRAQKRHCRDDDFFDRCRAYAALVCSEYTKVVEDNEKAQQGVEKFFRTLDKEQMDIAHQLTAFVTAYKTYDGARGCSLRALVNGAVDVFSRYLDMRRQETVEAFWGARAEGRYLALLVMREDAERYKGEILSYASDRARLVRDELLEILYGQRDWERDVRALLGAGKAAQREMAVQVLTRWQQEGGSYKDVFRQAMEKERSTKVLMLLQDALNM